MKVNNHDSAKLTAIRSKGTDPAASKSRGVGDGAHPASRSDEALAASHIDLVNRAQDAEDPGRTTRVSNIQAQIIAGQYHVDPAGLSKSLVRAALGEQ